MIIEKRDWCQREDSPSASPGSRESLNRPLNFSPGIRSVHRPTRPSTPAGLPSAPSPTALHLRSTTIRHASKPDSSAFSTRCADIRRLRYRFWSTERRSRPDCRLSVPKAKTKRFAPSLRTCMNAIHADHYCPEFDGKKSCFDTRFRSAPQSSPTQDPW